ncbi:MAG: threonine--tRNA ligase [Candidatus Peregrinibacteria bacterium]
MAHSHSSESSPAGNLYDKLITLLDEHKAHYRLIDHAPEGRSELVSKMRGNTLSQAANCIVVMVKIGKKTTKFVLAVYPADVKLDLNAVKALFQGTYVSFASPDIAERLAGSVMGTVLPFSFSEELELIVDPSLLENEEIFFNAARLDRSIALKASDYKEIAQARYESIVQGTAAPAAVVVKSQKKEPVVDALYQLRHSVAHVLAQAVLKLWPDTQVTIGPPIDTGCYYDFLFVTPITDEDLPKIEKEMRKIIGSCQSFEMQAYSIADAVAFWKKRGQHFKVELIEDLAKEGETEVTHYRNLDPKGQEMFVDLCRGGHVGNLRDIAQDGFKIMSLAGSYWRGDEKREQLTRIYVAAFASKVELDAYLTLMEEAKKRDHRKLGKEMDLFTFSELVGPGLPLWTPKGTILRNLLDDFVWELRRARGYEKVTIPHITKKDLYETSGHWQKFQNDLFKIVTREGHTFAMKPMNCPHHTQIYSSQARSYKDLPQRYAETTMCYRDEQTGELHGLSRLRAFTQDDAHVFCRSGQVKEEFLRIWDIIDTFYPAMGFPNLRVRLSLHDPEHFEKYLGTPEVWKSAEEDIRSIAKERGIAFTEVPGEAAFYGPKVDFMAKDAIGREWQVATIQLDINLPERFDLTCINEKGEKERIVMIHAAIMGAIERFLSIFIEHCAGHFPLWLAPVQVAIIPVAGPHEEYAQEVMKELKAKGIRAVFMDSSESLGKRIREGEKQRIPYLLVMGDKEVADKAVAVRNVVTKKQVTVPLDEFIARTMDDVKERRLGASIGE